MIRLQLNTIPKNSYLLFETQLHVWELRLVDPVSYLVSVQSTVGQMKRAPLTGVYLGARQPLQYKRLVGEIWKDHAFEIKFRDMIYVGDSVLSLRVMTDSWYYDVF